MQQLSLGIKSEQTALHAQLILIQTSKVIHDLQHTRLTFGVPLVQLILHGSSAL